MNFKKVLLSLFFVSLILTSCSDFLQGSSLKTELDAAIDDALLERVDVSIFAYNYQGTLKGETGGTYKLGGETYSLDFSENKGWQFVEWQVTDKAGNKTDCSSNDSIYIHNPLSAQTVFSVNGQATGYKIEAVCMARPDVEIFSPAYIASGVNGDSSLEISFAHSVDEESFVFSQEEFSAYGKFAKPVRKNSEDETSAIVGIDLGGEIFYKNIVITGADGESLSSYYKAPVLSADKTKVTMEVDTSKSFDFSTSPAKDIYVTLSDKIYYAYKTQNDVTVKVVPEKKYDFNYKISATTTAKARITISAKNEDDKVTGTLNYSGLQEFNIGQTVKVEFAVNSDFEFIGWDVLGNDDESVLTKADDSGIVITVVKPTDTVKIVPVCREKGIAEVTVYTTVGKVEHSESHSYRVGDEFTVTINHDSLYYFPGWKIRNSVIDEFLTDEDRDMYFYSEDWSKETATIKVVKECSNLVVEGGVYYRPFINFREPVYTSEGVNRNQSIKVYFDKTIDPMSLYYTEDEIKEIVQKCNGSSDITWIKQWITNKYYYSGYEFNGERYYKNITIVNNNTGENLAKCYDVPYLEPNGKTLVIPALYVYVSGNLQKDRFPPANTEISVEIGTEYLHIENGFSIPLEHNSNSNWFFTTNSKTDEIKPVLGTYSIKGTNETEEFTMKDDSSTAKTKPSTIDQYKNVYLKNGTKLVIDAYVKDNSKNLKYVYLVYKKIQDEWYQNIDADKQTEYRYSLSYGHVDYEVLPETLKADSSSDTKYTADDYVYKINDSLNMNSRSSGLYEIWISAQDEVNNEAKSTSYYVLVDNTGPDKTKTVDVSSMRFFRNGTKIKFCDWINLYTEQTKPKDFGKLEMYAKRRDSGTYTYHLMDYEKVIMPLEEDGEYSIEVWATDCFDNKTEVYRYTVYSPLQQYYTPKLSTHDYFYTNGWFSPGHYLNRENYSYDNYKVIGQYVKFNLDGGESKGYIVNTEKPVEQKTKSEAEAALTKLNDDLTAPLKGNLNWTYPPATFWAEDAQYVTKIYVYTENRDKDVYFYGSTSTGLGLRKYRTGTTGSPCGLSESGTAYLIPVAEIPTAVFE